MRRRPVSKPARAGFFFALAGCMRARGLPQRSPIRARRVCRRGIGGKRRRRVASGARCKSV
ncbi:hypothetical protein A8H37_08365 [Burkholderia thailandensis]|nr:hypothetical protein A8H37_08365 [Burkholderia thailandensis]